jgi:ribosomal protein S18 acetylase RimI-like enzyme
VRRGWEQAGRRELPALERFLRAREAGCAGLAGRLLREGRLRLPNPLRGGLWFRRDLGAAPEPADFSALLLFAPGGLVHPRWASSGSAGGEVGDREDAALGPLLGDRGFYPASAIGPAADVSRFEGALGLRPLAAVRYRLMELPTARPPTPALRPPPPGFSLRRAGAGDLETLLPLQAAYEVEEVVTSIHRFDPAGCRAGLARSLADQIVVLAEWGGRAVGKAQTNARSFSLDQIGGVYVDPAFRGRGLGRLLMEELLGLVAAEERGAVLFVKEENPPALALYRGLGFSDRGAFAANYYLG